MRILSVDFDYFIDTDMVTRCMHFPDGHDNFTPQLTKFIWDRCYEFKKDLADIGVIKDYDTMCDFLHSIDPTKVIVADSHKEIEQLFSLVKDEEDVELVNIDFHHDIFVTGGNELDCGNWLRFFADLNPEAKITWVRREDSDTDSFFGEFPYHHTTDIREVLNGEYDLVFMCFSSPWTPPHLYEKFCEMVRSLNF